MQSRGHRFALHSFSACVVLRSSSRQAALVQTHWWATSHVVRLCEGGCFWLFCFSVFVFFCGARFCWRWLCFLAILKGVLGTITSANPKGAIVGRCWDLLIRRENGRLTCCYMCCSIDRWIPLAFFHFCVVHWCKVILGEKDLRSLRIQVC